MNFTKLHLSGTPFQVGRVHGEASAEYFKTSLQPAGAAPQPAFHRYAMAMQHYLEAHFPEVLEEIRGLASGADLTFEEAFLFSASNALRVLPAPLHCSALAWRHPEAGVMLFKTDDIIGFDDSESKEAAIARHLKNRALFDWISGESYRVLVIGQRGCLWAETGINQHGLCIGSTSGRPVLGPQDGAGIPQHIFPLLVLRYCANCAEAVEFAQYHPVAGKGINLVVTDAGGNIITIEKCGPHTGVRHNSEYDYVVNHYRDVAMANISSKQAPEFFDTGYYQNSKARSDFLNANLSKMAHGTRRPLGQLRSLLKEKGACIWQCNFSSEEAMWTDYGTLLSSKSPSLTLFTDSPLESDGETFFL